jgi:uncharacterized protein with von Willebrand factor type A (vWA) domain
LRSSPFDRHLWARLRPDLAETSALLSARLPAGEALLADLFGAFHRADVRALDPAPGGAALFHAPLLEKLLASPGYARVHPQVRGDDQLAALACDAVARAMATRIDPELTEFLNEEEALAGERAELETEQAELERHIEERTRSRRPRPGEKIEAAEQLTMGERKQRVAEVAERLGELERAQHGDYRRVRLAASLRARAEAVDLPAITADLADDLSAFDRALATWGQDPAAPLELDLEPRLRLFRRLRADPTLAAATELLGRFRLRAVGIHRTRLPAAPVGLAGVEMGADLSRLLPSELGLAAEPAAEWEFLRRLAEGELLGHRFEERGEPSRGPLVVCVDESTSMAGEPVTLAKALGLAIIGIAVADGRPAALVRFSGPGELVVSHFAVGIPDPAAVARALSEYLAGGTDFDGPLNAALEFVASDSRYQDADILMITDGEGAIHSETAKRLRRLRDEGGARLFAVCLGISDAVFRDLASRTWPYAQLLSGGAEDLLDELVVAVHPNSPRVGMTPTRSV